MNVEIKYIADAGVVNQERLVLSVLREDDIGRYAAFLSTFTTKNQISSKVKEAFWFPDKRVRAGDLVVLYSKNGASSEKHNKDGSITHFFYWGLSKTVWNTNSDCAVLLHVDNWKAQGRAE